MPVPLLCSLNRLQYIDSAPRYLGARDIGLHRDSNRGNVVAVKGLARTTAILSALIISAIITPDATLFTMMLMAVPLMVLYEIGILAARLFGRGQATGVDLPLDPDLPIRTAGHRVR